MFTLPPLPNWNAAHPIIVHLPITLGFVAPVLIALSLLWCKHRTGLAVASWVILAAAAIFSQLAVASGGAAEHAATFSPAAHQVLEFHEDAGEAVRTVLIILAAAYTIVLVLLLARSQGGTVRGGVIGSVVVLLGLFPAMIMIANAGHLGGRLVHEFGVHAPLAPASTAAGTLPSAVPPGTNGRSLDD